MKIGAQFYTIRDFCKNLDDFSESLKKVAEIGYKTVQISGTCEYEPEWLRDRLSETGLECVITHNSPDRLVDDTEGVAADNGIYGCNYVGIGYFPHDPEKENGSTDDFIRIYKPVAKRLNDAGKNFMYHNHDGEFKRIDGKLIIERLEESMSADEMGFTLDTYWIQAGGGDPAYWIDRLSGRVPCIHLKDFAFGRKMAVIGEGNINFDRVFKSAEAAGTKYMLVEQDDCNGENPFDCLKRSYEHLRSLGFE